VNGSGMLVVVGDALLDRDLDGHVDRLCPEAPVPVLADPVSRTRPGGAALAATLAARDGCDVTLVAPVADDEAGQELRRLLELAGVRLVALEHPGPTPEKVRLRADGRLLLRVDYGDARPAAPVRHSADAVRKALDDAAVILVSDYGRGLTADPEIRDALGAAAARVPLVWDPHPRGATPVEGAALVTPSAAEASAELPEIRGTDLAASEARARTLLERWHASGVAITLGSRGALVVGEDRATHLVPAPRIGQGDPCGAGDRFAAAAAELLGRGAALPEAIDGAVRMASAFVAAGGASTVRLAEPETADAAATEGENVLDAIARVRVRGGTVVATGGCFDLLHAGHVSTLQAARELGDFLVVLLNSDESVARLKGPDRPLVPQAERAAVLAALSCVDAVVVFDEDTPEQALVQLRPDIFAKGGDYASAVLPEAAALAEWGGQVVILPFVDGRSTSQLIDEAARRG
jgi:D-beta-D-heptose 7-phosphate kinase / D-beta-D-heptose 1-phosphate adenosyltransferase